MFKTILAIIIFLLSSSFILAQQGWTEQTSNTSEDLQDLQFIDKSIGWACGGNAILRTSDKGVNWTSQISSTFADGLKDLHFTDTQTGWCIGSTGIIKTTNAGEDWISQASSTIGAGNGIYFPDGSNGWAIGDNGKIINSTNGGADWSVQNSGVTENLNAVFFSDENNGWSVGDNETIIVTTDGGANWAAQTSGTITGKFTDIYFVDANLGWISGHGGLVLKTTDAGSSWIKQNTNNSDDFYFVYFNDSNQGWTGGAFGTILYTSDGGDSWAIQASNVVVAINAIYFVSTRNGWYAGNDGKISFSASSGSNIRAKFDADVKFGILPVTVNFIDQSTGSPTAYLWDFGDGETSTEQNPTHIYLEANSYTVSLQITSGTFTSTKVKEDYIIIHDPLTADFEATPTAGSSTLTVNFMDKSLGYPTEWNWDFGDGSSSTFQNPTHSFGDIGFYTITLTVTNDDTTQKIIKTDYIEVYEVLTSKFSASPSTGQAPLSVKFYDDSPGRPNSWSWSFGDGGSSTDQNPTYVYQNSNTYTVSLTVSDGINNDIETKVGLINVTDMINAEFEASPTDGVLPLLVSFTDKSRGGPVQWSWRFGDGKFSTDQNPSHTYELPGIYTIELTVSDGDNYDTEKKVDYIEVTGTPNLISAFSALPTSGILPLTVQFNDESSGGVNQWTWDFGDGSVSDEQNPEHIYQAIDTFSVSLTVSNGLDTTSITKDKYIEVTEEIVTELNAEFTADITEGDEPLSVKFSDLSTGEPVSWYWDFGDGLPTTVTNPSHDFWNSGTYTVSLTIEDADGVVDTEEKLNYIIVNTTVGVDNYNSLKLPYINNYPNPFSSSTVIKYELPAECDVRIIITDILGNEVALLINERQNSGTYFLIWDAVDFNGELLQTGIYFYNTIANCRGKNYSETKKMIFIK